MAEFKFEFVPKKRSAYYNDDQYEDVLVFLNGMRRGTITLTPNEWNTLSKILVEGNYSQDGEIEILVNSEAHAFLKGASNGNEVLGGPPSTTD